MPPRPKYSKGCFACRRMKVKCDETKPQCRRCLKGGRVCPGFPEISAFLSMNGDFEAPNRNAYVSRHASPGPASNTRYSAVPLCSVQPSTDWERYATAYFLDNYVAFPAGAVPGYLQFLPEALSRSPSKCLTDALNAVAVTSLANISSTSTELRLRSSYWYGAALKSLAAALGSPKKDGDHDALLASIFLLQKRETLEGCQSSPDPHDAGLVGLMQCNPTHHTGPSSNHTLLHTVHARLLLQRMDAGWRSRGLDARASMLGSFSSLDFPTPPSNLWHLFARVSESCRAISQVVHADRVLCDRDVVSELRCVAEQGLTLEAELRAWCQQRSPGEMPAVFETSRYLTESTTDVWPTFVTHFRCYTDIQAGCRWLTYWTSRIYISLSLSDVNGHLFAHQPTYEPLISPEWILEDLLNAADGICSSVPYMLGALDSRGEPTATTKGKALGAYFTTRFLDILNEIPHLPDNMRSWSLRCLDLIGKELGIGSALRARRKWMAAYPLI